MHKVKAKSRELRKQHKPESFGPRFKSWWAHQIARGSAQHNFCALRYTSKCLRANRAFAASRFLDHALKLHGDAHIAFDFDFAAHESANAIKFAV